MKRVAYGVALLALTTLGAGTSRAQIGRAVITGTAEGSPITGMAELTETAEGLRIAVSVSNVPPGLHGFHIHELGSCEDGGNAAGSHYNPEGVKHGDLLAEGFAGAHAGDLGNLEVGADGTGSFERVFPKLTLTKGPYTVANRAVILHANPDNFGQPTGNAGGRIGCGVISVRSP